MTKQKLRLTPMHSVSEGIFNTATGAEIDLNNPTAQNINIDDIGNALSKICRWGGHTSAFYSVAQHSVIVAAMAPDSLKKEALLHDAHEAYIQDIISPLKVMLEGYQAIADRFDKVITKKFKLKNSFEHPEIKAIDMKVLEIEYKAFIQGNLAPWIRLLNKLDLLDADSHTWGWNRANCEFHDAYVKYFFKAF